MADLLASQIAADEDLLHCPFHFHLSVGGCRHGDPEDIAVRRDHPYRRIVQSDRQEHFQVICFVSMCLYVVHAWLTQARFKEGIMMPAKRCRGAVGLVYCRYFVNCRYSGKLSCVCMERVFSHFFCLASAL